MAGDGAVDWSPQCWVSPRMFERLDRRAAFVLAEFYHWYIRYEGIVRGPAFYYGPVALLVYARSNGARANRGHGTPLDQRRAPRGPGFLFRASGIKGPCPESTERRALLHLQCNGQKGMDVNHVQRSIVSLVAQLSQHTSPRVCLYQPVSPRRQVMNLGLASGETG